MNPISRALQPELEHALRGTPEGHDWHEDLPPAWRPMIVVPLSLEHYREYEMAASRTLGSDGDGRRCYYAHTWAITRCYSDDDEAFYATVTEGERLRAWRLRDERWLIYRIVLSEERGSRGFYQFSSTCPG